MYNVNLSDGMRPGCSPSLRTQRIWAGLRETVYCWQWHCVALLWPFSMNLWTILGMLHLSLCFFNFLVSFASHQCVAMHASLPSAGQISKFGSSLHEGKRVKEDYTISYYIISYYCTLHYITLHYITLHYITVQYSTLD